MEWAKIDTNIVDSSTHFIPKDAPHPNAARLFLWWSLSKDGQKIWDDIRGQGDPTRAQAPPSPPIWSATE